MVGEVIDPTQPRPQLSLTPARVICGLHGEPFKPEWPMGYAVFVTQCLEALKECEAWLNSIEGDAPSVEAALDKMPACCTIATHDPDLLLRVYEIVNKAFVATTAGDTIGGPLWPTKKCGRCRKLAAGTKFSQLVLPAGVGSLPKRVKQMDHLCLRCIATAPRVGTDVAPAGFPPEANRANYRKRNDC